MIFSFHMSADPSYTYNSTHYICSSTTIFLILILIYNLYAIKNFETFSDFPLNICGLATFIFDSVLSQGITATSPPSCPT